MDVSSCDTVASRNALRNALRNTIRDTRVTTSTTPDRPAREGGPKPDSLRSTRVGAIWIALAPPDEGAWCSCMALGISLWRTTLLRTCVPLTALELAAHDRANGVAQPLRQSRPTDDLSACWSA